MSQPILVSACLLGLATRYDGRTKYNRKVMDYLQAQDLMPVPVCPEQLAGFATPRPKTFFAAGDGGAVLDGPGRIVREDRSAMNDGFLRGAQQTLKIAELCGCSRALFKDGSPSCGVHRICRNGERVAGAGVTAALLQRHGLRLISEEDI